MNEQQQRKIIQWSRVAAACIRGGYVKAGAVYIEMCCKEFFRAKYIEPLDDGIFKTPLHFSTVYGLIRLSRRMLEDRHIEAARSAITTVYEVMKIEGR